jgi:hypothetical protein
VKVTRRLTLVVAAGFLPLLLASCGGAPSTKHGTKSSSPVPTITTGAWSKAIRMAPGANLSVVSCPVPGFCVAGSVTGQSYRLTTGKVSALGMVGPAPSPQGTSYLTCTSALFCAAVPNLNQSTLFNGTLWLPPVTIPGAQGFTAIGCVGTTFCISIDGEGNSFIFNGAHWSGNVGAYGAANQISCVSPQFCAAVEGGPTVWNGHAWSEPSAVDGSAQLNAVSCASATFCMAVDSGGGTLTWNGTAFSAPAPMATEPPLSGTDASGLTGVSCPTSSFCRAVDTIGRVFDFDGTTWSAGTLIDSGTALTGISCPTVNYCVAVDRQGNAFVSGSAPKA